MRLIECATCKHSFVWQGTPAELVFGGHTLELDDDLAAHLLEESPGNFTDVTPKAETTEDTTTGETNDKPTTASEPETAKE